ncbi:hypothetical protein E2P60_02085 [Candidatus Bathyarchaeota archaeon]|nr:hypothetical protein E2P60_02085 [Candidatus Bathyarchaeota archaeon]
MELPSHLKISLLIIAFSFLVFSAYWAVYSVFWVYNITINITSWLQALSIISPMQQIIIIIQEYAASTGYFLAFIGAIIAIRCTILYIKNDKKYLDELGKALFLEALFILLLIPSSVHHLLGAALSWTYVDIYVGLSYLIQVLFIAPPFLKLAYNLRKPQNQASILKWVTIAAPLTIWGFWIKYLFLWSDTLSPLGPKQATLGTVVGAAKSCLTLLIAGIITFATCLILYRKRKVDTRLVGVTLILIGSHFIIYYLVSIWVNVYSSFLYLTDFWMTAFPILGIAALGTKSFNVAMPHLTHSSRKHQRKIRP